MVKTNQRLAGIMHLVQSHNGIRHSGAVGVITLLPHLKGKILSRRTQEKMTFDDIELESEQETILGIVIEPGIKDCSGQVLSKEEISEAMSIYNSIFNNVLIQHRDALGRLPNFDDIANIQGLENWQHTFNDKVEIVNSFQTSENCMIESEAVIAGTWLMELSINDPEIRKAVDNGYLRGLSYGGAGCLVNVNSHTQVVDLLPAEISLVDHPCNRKEWLRKAEVLRKPYVNEFSCRVADPDDFDKDSFRRIEREKDGRKFSIIIAKRPGETTTEAQAFRYPTSDWSKDLAQAHCQRQQGIFEDIQREE